MPLPQDLSEALRLSAPFQGWAVVPSGEDGGFKFVTIVPGSYPAARNWYRPPHIHFKITKFAYQTLTTQMYFPGQPLNAKDKLIERKSKEEQAMMIAELVEKTEDQYRYNIFLAPVGKAVAPQQE